jgi:hypothetical protein
VNSALSVIDGSRPPTARPATSNSQALRYIPTASGRSRAPTNETMGSVRWMAPPDPRDPRSHWVKGPEADQPSGANNRLRHSWSPHLYPDKRAVGQKGKPWTAPSMDSRTEPLLGRRNMQVWSFCLGFVFPLGKSTCCPEPPLCKPLTTPCFSLVHRRIPSIAGEARCSAGRERTRTGDGPQDATS